MSDLELTRAPETNYLNDPQFHVVLFHPEIPQNTGTIGRICVGTNSKLWLVRPLGFHITDHQLKRAGLDYWPKLDWEAVNDWSELQQRMRETFALLNRPLPPFWYFSKKAEKRYYDVQYHRGDVFIFGPESVGLPEFFLKENPDTSLRIPTNNAIRSLNISVSAGIAIFEAQKQLDN